MFSVRIFNEPSKKGMILVQSYCIYFVEGKKRYISCNWYCQPDTAHGILNWAKVNAPNDYSMVLHKNPYIYYLRHSVWEKKKELNRTLSRKKPWIPNLKYMQYIAGKNYS